MGYHPSMKLAGYLHVHSTYSYDGKVSLVDLKQGLVARGVDFVCLTEHTDWLTQEKYQAFFRECQALSDEKILLIPGLEVSFPDAHIILAGLSEGIDPRLDPTELVKQGHAQGAFVVFAHPHRSRFRAPAGIESYLQGIEIWNGQYDGKRVPRPAAWSYRDQLARQRKEQLFVTAGADFHRWSHLPGPGLEVEAEERTPQSILRALREGRYTIAGQRLTLASDASLDTYPHPLRLRLVSTVTLQFIRLARSVNALLKRWNISLPKSLLERIRGRV